MVVLRELFRHYLAFRTLYETDGIDEIIAPDGSCWVLWDVEYLLEQVERLAPRQRDSIRLCLIEGMREKDAAIAFGLSPTNPVLSYATVGLERIVGWVHEGSLPRFRSEAEVAA